MCCAPGPPKEPPKKHKLKKEKLLIITYHALTPLANKTDLSKQTKQLT